MRVSLSIVFTIAASPAFAQFISTVVNPTDRTWYGYGMNQYPNQRDSNSNDIPWTDQAFALTTKRLDFMRPGLTRIIWDRPWFNPSGTIGTYDWSGKQAQNTFKLLEWYNSRGYAIQTGMWHLVPENFYTSQDAATLATDLIDELINVRGYTNIKFWAGMNEPEGASLTVQDWESNIRNFYQTKLQRGLGISIAGPDAYTQSYITTAAQWDTSYINAIDWHNYPARSDIAAGNVEGSLNQVFNNVKSLDPSNLPVYLSELGGDSPSLVDQGYLMENFDYARNLFDYGIQVARSSHSGAMTWCLDGFDSGKNCGAWDSSGNNGGFTLRPWFYTWSLLSRYLGPGTQMHIMTQPGGVRIVGGRLNTGSNGLAHWTFALVNQYGNAQLVTLKVPGWGQGEFNVYSTVDGVSPVNGDGFPVPASTVSGTLAGGINVNVPAWGAVLITTQDGSPLPTQGTTIEDELADWSKVAYHSDGWTFDNSKANAYFDGDATRIKRTDDTLQYIYYEIQGGITGFQAKIYSFGDITGSIYFQTSPDEKTWTTVTATTSQVYSNSGGWSHVYFTNSGALPSNAKYLVVGVQNNANIWTPQVAKVIVWGN